MKLEEGEKEIKGEGKRKREKKKNTQKNKERKMKNQVTNSEIEPGSSGPKATIPTTRSLGQFFPYFAVSLTSMRMSSEPYDYAYFTVMASIKTHFKKTV